MSNEAGFTLQETLVVLLVGSMLIVYSFDLYQSVTRIASQSLVRRNTETSLATMARRIALDIIDSRRVIEISESSLILDCEGGRQIRYRFGDGELERNGMVLSRAELDSILVVMSKDNIVRSDNRELTSIDGTLTGFKKGRTWNQEFSAIHLESNAQRFNAGRTR